MRGRPLGPASFSTPMKTYPYLQISRIEDLPQPEEGTSMIGHYAFQYIDFRDATAYALTHRFVDCCFFGCQLCPGQEQMLQDCLVLPRMGMTFHAFHSDLYSAASLYEGFVPGEGESLSRCFDARVAAEYQEQGPQADDLRVMLARTLHDHSIYDAMQDFLRRYDPQNVIGIMGGHSLKRGDDGYAAIVKISKKLTEKGKLMVSGGGPGAMEATHLGAWMAGRTDEEVEDALQLLRSVKASDPVQWLESAFEVIRRYPQTRYESLSIPTWLYAHEPSTPFATRIAKFFTNSVREDMILSVTLGGILFTPGSAGTMQEIFQCAAKVHYDTDGIVGPMVFFGRDFFERVVPVYPFLSDLKERGKYANMKLSITDDPQVVIDTLL